MKDSLVGDLRRIVDPARAAELGFGAVPFFWEVTTDFVLAPVSQLRG